MPEQAKDIQAVGGFFYISWKATQLGHSPHTQARPPEPSQRCRLWALVGRGPAEPDPRGPSPTSLAGNTVFHFSKDSEGTDGPLDSPPVLTRLNVL